MQINAVVVQAKDAHNSGYLMFGGMQLIAILTPVLQTTAVGFAHDPTFEMDSDEKEAAAPIVGADFISKPMFMSSP